MTDSNVTPNQPAVTGAKPATPAVTPQAPVTPAVQTPAGLPAELASLIPEKYKGDLKEFVKAYNAMGAKIRAKGVDPEGEAAPQNPAQPKSISAEQFESQLERELYLDGKLSEASKQYYKNMGHSDRWIATQERILETQATEFKTTLKDNSDGEDPKEVENFVNAKVAKGEYTKAYADMLNASLGMKEFGLYKSEVAKLKAAKGAASANPAIKSGTVSSSKGDGFTTAKDYRTALKAAGSDKSKIAAVYARVEMTDPSIVSTFNKL